MIITYIAERDLVIHVNKRGARLVSKDEVCFFHF